MRYILSVLVAILFFSSLAAIAYANPFEKVKIQEPQGKPQPSSSVDINKIENGAKNIVDGVIELGIITSVFFFVVGWMIIVIANGLKHPEYMKWGRGTVFVSILAYFFIKILPVIMYRL